MIALPTIRNTAAYDIIVASPRGDRHANIQVKTSKYRTRHWLMPEPKDIRAGKHDYYVFVRRYDAEDRFEAFLATGQEAKSAVQETIKYQRQNRRKFVTPAVDEDPDSPRLVRWRKAWDTWSLERIRGT
jgi:hypothetical protein